jgi:hypothetical protein
MLVDVVFTRSNLLGMKRCTELHLLAYRPAALCQYYQLMARDIVFLNGLPDNLLRDAVAVDVRGIPCVYTAIICCF